MEDDEEQEQGDSADDEAVNDSLTHLTRRELKTGKNWPSNSVWDVTINSIASVTVTNGGYRKVPNVTITEGGGNNDVATVIITGGVVTKILLDSPGSFYTSATIPFERGSEQNATTTALLGKIGSLRDIDVTSSGEGYTSSPTANFEGGGRRDVATTVVVHDNIVSSILLTNAGSVYAIYQVTDNKF